MLRISGPNGVKPIDVDGLLADIVIALIVRRRDILASTVCQIRFDIGPSRPFRMSVTPSWNAADLKLPSESAS